MQTQILSQQLSAGWFLSELFSSRRSAICLLGSLEVAAKWEQQHLARPEAVPSLCVSALPAGSQHPLQLFEPVPLLLLPVAVELYGPVPPSPCVRGAIYPLAHGLLCPSVAYVPHPSLEAALERHCPRQVAADYAGWVWARLLFSFHIFVQEDLNSMLVHLPLELQVQGA